MSRRITQDDFNKVHEHIREEDARRLLGSLEFIYELAKKGGIAIAHPPDSFDLGFATGFLYGSLARSVQEHDGEIEEVEHESEWDDPSDLTFA